MPWFWAERWPEGGHSWFPTRGFFAHIFYPMIYCILNACLCWRLSLKHAWGKAGWRRLVSWGLDSSGVSSPSGVSSAGERGWWDSSVVTRRPRGESLPSLLCPPGILWGRAALQVSCREGACPRMDREDAHSPNWWDHCHRQASLFYCWGYQDLQAAPRCLFLAY